MVRQLLFVLTVFAMLHPARAEPIESDIVCVGAREGVVHRADRIVVVTGFAPTDPIDGIVVVTGFKGAPGELACVLSTPPAGLLPAMRLPVLCHADGHDRLSCRR